VVVPGYASEPAVVTTDAPGQRDTLLLDIEERVDENGTLTPIVVLRR